MTPTAIQPEVDAIKAQQQKIAGARKQANAPQTTFTTVEAPSCSVAGEAVDNGSRAACFGNYMRIHALGSSNGLTYAARPCLLDRDRARRHRDRLALLRRPYARAANTRNADSMR